MCGINHGVSGSSPEGGAKKVALAAFFCFMHYLYILYSETSDIYYVGQSHDPWERYTHHSSDENDSFTSKHRPWEIKAVFEVGTRSNALKIEKFIKKQKSRKLIEMLIQPDFVPSSSLAQLVRVPHVRD